VMRYFRSLSHASTLDSLSSSFMCNVVNEANTVVPPPYSCDSADELSAVDSCDRRPTANVGSTVSLTNHRTTSDVSSLAAQSPCSPPRATSPTIEVRFSTLRCDSYFRVDDETTHSSFRPHYFLYRLSRWTIHFLRDSHLPRLESIDVSGIRFSRDVQDTETRDEKRDDREETTWRERGLKIDNDTLRSHGHVLHSYENCWTRYSSFLVCLTGTPPPCLASP